MKDRRRMVWLMVLALIVLLGLGSRRSSAQLPTFVAIYAGDTLYATAVFALIAMLFTRWPTTHVAIVALAACVIVEVSQLYHAPWIDSIRATHPGGWILGFGFLWTDLICYVVGVGIMAALTRLVSAGSISSRRHTKKEL